MSIDDAIRLAREAGAPDWWIGLGANGEVTGPALGWLIRFMALAATSKRKERTTRSRKFRWTRKLYRQAHRESRIYWRYGFMSHDEPPLVKRLLELWEQHPQLEDPLLQPFRWRHDYCPDGIPF